MTGMQIDPSMRVSETAGLEAQLADVLASAADEVARLESLDEEQRAEVYAILGAIQTDVEVHRQLVSQLPQPSNQACCHA